MKDTSALRHPQDVAIFKYRHHQQKLQIQFPGHLKADTWIWGLIFRRFHVPRVDLSRILQTLKTCVTSPYSNYQASVSK